jgi:hypothetical protein
MAAVISKNELVAAKRRALMLPTSFDGSTPLWRAASFVGRAFVGKSSAGLVAATGTMTNVRKPLTFTAFTFTADSATDKIAKTNHKLETGDGPFTVSNSGGALPGGLAAATNYWVIKFDDDNIKVASSLDNAYLGTAIDITSNGTGTQTATAGASCERGLDGMFIMEFTQTETNFDGSELLAVCEDGQKVFTADNTTETMTSTAHELRTGSAFTVSNVGGALPTGLAASTTYYAIRTGANTIKPASSFANALAGTAINFTTDGTGTNYIDATISRAITTVNMQGSFQGFETVGEGAHTYGDLMRLMVGILAGEVLDFETGTQVFRNLADTVTRLTGTTTPNGRTAITVGDLTTV